MKEDKKYFKNLHFFNDTGLTGRDTNIFTRKKMVEGISKTNLQGEISVHYLKDKEGDLVEKTIETENDVGFIPVSFNPAWKSETLKVLIKNRAVNLIYLKRMRSLNKDSLCYIWGLRSALSACISDKIHGTNYILELDDYVFGKNKINDWIYLKAALNSLRVITVSKQTKKDLVDRGVDSEKIKVLPNAVESKRFNLNREKTSIRRDLGLPEDKFLIGYTGHLYKWKGVETLLEAVKYLDDDYMVFLVGGKSKDIEKYEKLVESMEISESVEVIGYVKRSKVPLYQNAADVLVLPNTSRDLKSQLYTSPVKLKEYMATPNPIIASNNPSIRQEITEDECFFFKPDKPIELAETIIYVSENPVEAAEKAEKSLEKAENYTWKDRASEILNDLINS